jgi:hypothetical protein
MTSQPDIFGGGARKTVPEFPEGFRYRPELITPDDEASLLALVRRDAAARRPIVRPGACDSRAHSSELP